MRQINRLSEESKTQLINNINHFNEKLSSELLAESKNISSEYHYGIEALDMRDLFEELRTIVYRTNGKIEDVLHMAFMSYIETNPDRVKDTMDVYSWITKLLIRLHNNKLLIDTKYKEYDLLSDDLEALDMAETEPSAFIPFNEIALDPLKKTV